MDFAAFMAASGFGDCLRYWLRLPRTDGVPEKRQLDPAQMPRHILPWLVLYQRMPNGRYLCRLMGTGACAMWGEDPTWRYVDEILPPAAYAARRAPFDECLDQGRPLGFQARLVMRGREWKTYRRLMLPLRCGAVVDHVFSMVSALKVAEAGRMQAPPTLDGPETIVRPTDRDLAPWS